jgi:hypothetical protein
MTKILVCGSRTFDDEARLHKELNKLVWSCGGPENVEIVSGGAKGPDTYAAEFAAQRGMRCKVFPADWEKYGKSAGFIRNTQMREYCNGSRTVVLAVWDGKSRGTAHMIDLAEKMVDFEVRRLMFEPKE